MNCAAHPEVPASAYCRTCGKPLCDTCKHDVRGVIYCEDCIAARLQGTLPVAPAGAVPPPPPLPVVISSGPNPGLAGVLAAFFPFGVGQVYTGQYAKGLVYLIIFALLVWGASSNAGPDWLFGLGIAFYWVYQIIDAVRSARAVQLGQKPPDPLGTSRMFAGAKLDRNRIPVGAVVLIIIGLLLFLYNMGHYYWMANLWPAGLMALGVWLIVRRWSDQPCACPRCRWGGIAWPVFLVALGVLWLLENVSDIGFHRTWPLLLIVLGVCIVMERSAPATGHIDTTGPATPAGITEPKSDSQQVGNA